MPQGRQFGFVGCPADQRRQHPVDLRVVAVVEQREYLVDEVGRGGVLIPGDPGGISGRRRTYLPP
jgi:hypothetical protein